MIVVDLVVGAIAGVAVAALVLALSRRPARVHIPSHLAPRAPTESPRPAPPARSEPAPNQLMVVPPEKLPTFAEVGGMQSVKDDVRNTLGVVLTSPERAREYRVTWNGVLLHGQPGTGKSLFARALAGEFGCNLVEVDTADLVTRTAGDGPRLVEAAFTVAASHLPC